MRSPVTLESERLALRREVRPLFERLVIATVGGGVMTLAPMPHGRWADAQALES